MSKCFLSHDGTGRISHTIICFLYLFTSIILFVVVVIDILYRSSIEDRDRINEKKKEMEWAYMPVDNKVQIFNHWCLPLLFT